MCIKKYCITLILLLFGVGIAHSQERHTEICIDFRVNSTVIDSAYSDNAARMQEIIDNSHDNKEISNATKRKEKLQKQIKETKDYDAKIAHLALSRIDIDLDDGVKVNYEKVQTADGKKMQILAKI